MNKINTDINFININIDFINMQVNEIIQPSVGADLPCTQQKCCPGSHLPLSHSTERMTKKTLEERGL